MTLLLVPAALLIILGLSRETRKALAWAWRWLSGRELDGKLPRTDATWTRRYTKVLHPTGNAYEWHKMPRWQRAAIRTGVTVFALDAAAGMVFARRAAIIALAVTGTALAAWVASLAWRKARRWIPRRAKGAR